MDYQIIHEKGSVKVNGKSRVRDLTIQKTPLVKTGGREKGCDKVAAPDDCRVELLLEAYS